jgi:hypothetical protein
VTKASLSLEETFRRLERGQAAIALIDSQGDLCLQCMQETLRLSSASTGDVKKIDNNNDDDGDSSLKGAAANDDDSDDGDDDDDDDAYHGHYILVLGGDRGRNQIHYLDPSCAKHVCCMYADVFDVVRRARGTDEDIIWI